MNARRGHRRAAIAFAIVAVQVSQLPARAYPGDVFQNGAAAVAPASNDTAETGDAAYGVSDQGGAQYTIPIVVPPGRQGMAPSLALSYSSRAPVRGGLASGWSLSLPRIEVDTSGGRLGGTEYKTWSGARLIRVTEPAEAGVATYRADHDDTFARYELVRKEGKISWRVRTLDGQVLYFGESSGSRDVPYEASAAGAEGARWYITRSVDRFGNEVRYSYQKAWSLIRNETTLAPVDIFPTTIEWGTHSDATVGYRAHARVAFDHASEDLCPGSWVPIGASFSWRTGFPLMEGARRMTAIRVEVYDRSVWTERRRYTLRYDTDELKCKTSRTHAPLRLLTSVQERATSPEGTVLTLPSITFEYGRRELELTSYTGIAPIGSGTNAQAPQKAGGWPTLDSMLLDLDGDGRLDLLWSNPTLDRVECGVTWQRNRGDGTFDPAATFTLPTNPWRDRHRDDSDDRNSREGCSLSHQFSRAVTDGERGCGLSAVYTSYRFMDVTGDGRPDLVTAIDANHGRYKPMDDCRLWGGDGGMFCDNQFQCSDDAGACLDDSDPHRDPVPMRCAVSSPVPNFTQAPIDDDDNANGCPDGMCPYPGCDPNYGFCDCTPDNCSLEEYSSLADIYSPPIDHVESSDIPDLIWSGPSYASGGTGTEGRRPSYHNYACAQQPEEQCGRFVWRVYPNTGHGFADDPEVILSPIPLESDRATSSLGAGALAASSSWHGFLDMDGDSLMDAVFMTPFWNYSGVETGSPPQTFQVFRGDGTGNFQGDVNGSPYLWSAPTIETAGDDLRARVKLQSSHRLASSLGRDELRATYTTVTLEDVNGDGLPDYVDARDPLDGGNRVHVFYNTGAGFETGYRGNTLEVPDRNGVQETVSTLGENQQYVLDWQVNGQLDRGWSRDVRRMVDVDADGLLDLVVLPALQADERNPWTPQSRARLFINVGDRLVPMGATAKLNLWWRALARIRSTDGYIHNMPTWALKTDFLDLDGDGLPEAFTNDDYVDSCTPDPDTFDFDPVCGHGERSWTTPRDGQGMRLLRTVRTGTSAEVRFDYEPARGGRVPHPVWVVRSMSVTPGGGAPAMATSYGFEKPVYSQDDRGDWAFRGFETTTTTAPSGARTVKRFDHAVDWTGPLVETRVEEANGHVDQIVRTSWERRSLFDHTVTTLHSNRVETRTCAASQTAAECELAGAVRADSQLWSTLHAGIGGPLALAHAVAESVSTDGTAVVPGSKRSVQSQLLLSDTTRYWLLPLIDEQFVADSSSSWTQIGKVTHQWDSTLRVVVATTEYADAASPATTTHAYDLTTGNLIGERKPEQAAADLWTLFGYDATGVFVTRAANELGHLTDATWDPATGAQLSSRGPNAKANGTKDGWKRRIDGLGRTLEESIFVDDSAAGYVPVVVARTAYVDVPDADGMRATKAQQRIELDQDRWTSVTTHVDGLGRPVDSMEQAGGEVVAVSRNHYDTRGFRVRSELPSPQTTGAATISWSVAYDSLGRQLEVLGPDGSGVRWRYDGRATTREDIVGAAGGSPASTLTIADGFGRLRSVAELTEGGHHARTVYGYDGHDVLTSIEDADGLVTTMQHDWKGQRVAIARGPRTWKYTYDRNGRMVGTIGPVPAGSDASRYVTTIVYDALDREVSRVAGSRALDADQLARYGAASVTRSYDGDPADNGIGRLTVTKQPWGTTSYKYDARGLPRERRFKVKLPGSGVEVDRTERTSYNGLGSPREVTYADGATPAASTNVRFAMNDRGQPSTATWAYTGQPLASYQYTAAGGVSLRSLDGVYFHSIGYDSIGRVDKHSLYGRTPSNATMRPRAATSYVYDGTGNVESMSWGLGADGTIASERFDYAYDRQHQLIAATGPAKYDAAFVYSDAGRVVAATVDAYDAVDVVSREVTYDYAADDDLETADRLIGPDGATWMHLSHDDHGNTTYRGGGGGAWTQVYDGFDLQREVVGGPGSEVYWYDADGQRVGVATYDPYGALERIRWNYGATEIWHAPDGKVAKTIAHVGPARIEDRILAEYVFSDHYGHTLAVLGDNGAMLAGFVYGPFGEILRQAGTETGEVFRRFNGKEHDATSALIYYGYRYFDPLTLTWTQADPLYRLMPDVARDAPRLITPYAFSLNNALTYVDPDGLQPADPFSVCAECMMDGLAQEDGYQDSDLTMQASDRASAVVGLVFAHVVLAAKAPGLLLVLEMSQASDHNGTVGPALGFGLAKAFKGLTSAEGVVASESVSVAAALSNVEAATVALTRGSAAGGGFARGISAAEIAAINARHSCGTAMVGKDISVVLANASRRTGFYRKLATVIRDIAGGHLFKNGNKRTAFDTAKALLARNGIRNAPSDLQLAKVVKLVAEKKLEGVDDIANALSPY